MRSPFKPTILVGHLPGAATDMLGPDDGFLYVLTEEDEAALLKIEPTP
jgi:hypothetical protein